MCNLTPVIAPNEKLTKMLIFVKIICIINILAAILRIFTKPSDMLFDIFCALFLFLAFNTLSYIYAAIYIIFALMNTFYLFIACGIIFQMMIQGNLGEIKSRVPIVLSISLFLFIFYIFAIIFIYPVYKEMRAIQSESRGTGVQPAMGGAGINQRLNANADVERSTNTQATGAFTGRGTVVGGN